MFEKNDKPLFIVRILLIVMCLIIAIGSVITFIVLCCVDGGENIVIGLIPLFCGPLVAWLMWIFGQLSLNMMCDIKLIRNKLYEEGIESFKPFLEYKTSAEDEEEQDEQPQAKTATPQATPSAANTADVTQQLLKLKKLLDEGAITQEEFDAEKAKLLK